MSEARLTALETKAARLRDELDGLAVSVRELELSDARTGTVLQQLDTLWTKFDGLAGAIVQLSKDIGHVDTQGKLQNLKIVGLAIGLSAIASLVVSILMGLLF